MVIVIVNRHVLTLMCCTYKLFCMFNACNCWNECVYVGMYVCMSEVANSVSGEMVRVEHMFINLGKSAFEMHKLK